MGLLGPGDHQWGGFDGYVGDTGPNFHAALSCAAVGAQANGFDVPSVTGSAGASFMGGTAVYELMPTPLIEELGASPLGDDGGALALQGSLLVEPEGGANSEYKSSLLFYAVWIHEKTHAGYGTFFESWCTANLAACAAFHGCLLMLGHDPSNGYNPCDEQDATAEEKKAVCAEYMEVCYDDQISQEERDAKLSALNEHAQSLTINIVIFGNECAQCNGPLPPGSPGTGGMNGCDC